MDHYLHRCNHDAFYKHRNTLKNVDHPCPTCATCVKDRLYDPDPCGVCSKWLQNIKDKNVEAETSSSLWLKWNRSLVGNWKHNRAIPYNDSDIDMLIWADTESSPSGSLFCRHLVFVAGDKNQGPVKNLCQQPPLQ